MNERISLQDFRFNTMSMLNLLQDVESNFPEGAGRDSAYEQVGIDIGLGESAFTCLS